MSAADIVIVGAGMTTAVGLSAAETSASVRSGTMRFSEITWRDAQFQPFVVAETPEDGLPELAELLAQDISLTYRESRLLRLGAMPLLQALVPLQESNARPGLVVALPELETTKPLDPQSFLRQLEIQTGGAFDAGRSHAGLRGRAGGLSAIGMAASAIQSGRAEFLLAGGIDTYRDPYILGVLNSEGRVKTETCMDGFVPGEGAAFLLLTTRANAAAARMTALATVSPVSNGFEPGHLYSKEPYRGEGLAEAIQKFFSESAFTEPIREVYSSMNGENHWAKEWGVGYLRNKDRFDPAVSINHPADCYGDTGAASGPLMAGLAALGMLQNFRRSPALVYCSSDRGERAALAIVAERS